MSIPQNPPPASVRKVKVEVLKSFLLYTVASTCVGVMYIQWTHIWMLKAEMAEISQRFRPLETAAKGSGICCDAAACCGVADITDFLSDRHVDTTETQEMCKIRRNGDIDDKGNFGSLKGGNEKLCQKLMLWENPSGGRTLKPYTITNLIDNHDTTVLSWALGQSRGEGFNYQVLYKDTTWVMGHVITKSLRGAETKLMKCLKSMPRNISQPLNTCYTAGVHFLESGSTLQLSVPRKSAEIILTAHATFMGIFNI